MPGYTTVLVANSSFKNIKTSAAGLRRGVFGQVQLILFETGRVLMTWRLAVPKTEAAHQLKCSTCHSHFMASRRLLKTMLYAQQQKRSRKLEPLGIPKSL